MHLVLGGSGAFGRAMVRAWSARGERVRVLVRDAANAPDGAEVRVGDPTAQGDILEHSEGCTTIVAGVRVPWSQWDPAMVRATAHAIDGCLERGATLIFPGTMDGRKPIFTVPLPAPAPVLDANDFPVRKGELRNQIEHHIVQFVEEFGGRAILVRSNDWFGPGVRGLQGEIQAAWVNGGTFPWYGPTDVERALAFVDDVATVAAGLRARDDLPALVEVNVAGHAHTAAEWARAFGGKAQPKRVHKWQVVAKGLFDRETRELVELLHNWKGPLLLDDSRARRLLPDWRPVPFEEAVARTRAAVGGR